MTRHRPVLSTEPRRASIALALLSIAAASSFLAPSAHAGKAAPDPAPSSVATAIQVVVSGLELPDASGSPAVLVEQGTPFTVTANLVDAVGDPAAYSTKADTTLTVSISAGTGAGAVLGGVVTAVVPATKSTAEFSALGLGAIPPAVLTATDVQLTVRATAPARAVKALAPGVSDKFDVVKDAATVVPVDRTKSLVISSKGEGIDNACEATPQVPTCADVLLPNGVDSNVFFSAGSGYRCAVVGCEPDNGEVLLLLQVLADLDKDVDLDLDGEHDPLYTSASPATVVFKCDKSLCGGGGVPSKQLWVNLEPTGELSPAPPCGGKNLMDAPGGFCVDYTQSKRDGSGDTYLFLLLIKDVRMSF